MKVLHICLQGPYNDYWGYQDNLLPKYHRKMGYEVTVIATTQEHSSSGLIETGEREYVLNDGQKIIRKKYENNLLHKLFSFVKTYRIYDIIYAESPDIIFVHGVNNFACLEVVKYAKKNKSCRIYADNHVDYYNQSPVLKRKGIKRSIVLFILRSVDTYVQNYYIKVFGVTPWRVQYQQDVLRIKAEKSDLLVLGADDENIDYDNRDIIRKNIRDKYNIPQDAVLLVSGGKIDISKNMHLLIDAVNNLDGTYLFIFGNIDEQTEELIPKDYDRDRIKLLGWIDSSDVYDYFLASDLAVFPGTHSVLWEQSCACGIPGVFKFWEGMQHVNVCGNARFLQNVSEKEISNEIQNVFANGGKIYYEMNKQAKGEARKTFLYSEIAKKSIGEEKS